ncbi:histidine phosphatase family protein [Actinomyces oricola]|uniref:histidine phosphatase family protein n=1 Tax=Actinomyces oricola TaxID=206043 RepID=UPI000FFE91C5|nr:histidine phosphatase family protein [Actinomyces oricola]
MAKIHFVRHGRTVLNEQHRTQGRCDSPLTPEGRLGAQACRDYLADVPVARAYLSPQGRVLETAEILLQAHPGAKRIIVEGLREYDYGIYDGGPDPQMHAAMPLETHVPAVLSGTHPGAPDGISARDYLANVDGALARIMADLRAGEPDQEVLAISHGMTIMTLMARWVGPEVFGMSPMANCSVTTVEVDPTIVDGAVRLLQWAVDPGNQGVTFPFRDITGVFEDGNGMNMVPIDFSHPAPALC